MGLFSVWIIAFAGCRNNAVAPPVDSQQHYLLYAGNWGYDQVYVVDTDSNTVIDTLRGFGSVFELAITRSGRKLYVCAREGLRNSPGVLYAVDLTSKSTKAILQKSTDVYIRPDGVPMVIASTPYDTMRQVGTIDTTNDQITLLDTLDILDTGNNSQALAFSPNLPYFFTLTNERQLIAYDYFQSRIVKKYASATMPNMIISPSGAFLFFANGPIIDFVRDSILEWIPSYNGTASGSLALSLDGSKLYLTDPAKYWIPEPTPSGRIKIFETSTYSNVGYIDVNLASGQAYTITDRIVILRDGKTGYVTDSGAKIFVLDVEKNIVVSVIDFEPRNIMLRPLAVGVK